MDKKIRLHTPDMLKAIQPSIQSLLSDKVLKCMKKSAIQLANDDEQR